MTPDISIITVTYNSARTLKNTIVSLRSQILRNFEYIVVDGGSNDDTLEVIKAAGDIVTRWVSEPDGGIYDAINKGISMSQGRYIGLLHADDMMAGNLVTQWIQTAINSHNPDVVYGNLDYVSATDSSNIIRQWISAPFEKRMLKNGWMPPHPTVYVERSWFEKIGKYNASMKISADYDFILRLFSQDGLKTSYLPMCMVKMRVGGASNRSLKNIIQKMKEDYISIRNNHIGGVTTLLSKNISKIGQFLIRRQPNLTN